MALTPNVVDGALIMASWGNEVRDRSVQVFATAAERDLQWAAPPNGAMCTTLDTGAIWTRKAGVWVLVPFPGPDQRSIVASAVDAVTTTAVYAATLDFGTVTYKRVMVVHASIYATAINAAMSGRSGIYVNGASVRLGQGRNLAQNESETISVAASFQVAAGTAALIQLAVMRMTGGGAYRVLADPQFSSLDCAAFIA